MIDEPFFCRLYAVCLAHLCERGCRAKVASLLVVGVGNLVVDMKRLQKSVFIAIPRHNLAGLNLNELAADVSIVILCRF